MPAPVFRSGRARVLAALLASAGFAPGISAQATDAPSVVEKSSLDANLFYQLLIGEIELRSGEAGTAYQVMLEAAKRTGNEQIFKRATEIALQARAGEQALAAVVAWRAAVPDSVDALRYQVQLLLALNRPSESAEPLAALLAAAPAAQRPLLIASLPRLYARSTDRRGTAELLEKALQPYLADPATRSVAGSTLGRSWLAALEPGKALEIARRTHEADRTAEGSALLALEMLPSTPEAEPIVTSYLAERAGDANMRLLYVRNLAASQRYAEAVAQLEELTRRDPQLAPPWLTLGALRLELRQPAEATEALKRYVELVQGGSPVVLGAASAAEASAEDGPPTTSEALTQAWLLLAQAAEAQSDYAAAESWLARIDNPQRALEVQLRRASILTRQGRLPEARELIRRVPEQSESDARAKLLAEAQLLREQKDWREAEQVLAQANERFPNDVDLLYEQAMMAEKSDRLAEMETLLRRVIELKPDHHHAYNALGYSLAERNIRLPEARELIRKALELSPGEPFITDSLGWVEYRLGHLEEAVRLLREAYRTRSDPEIAAHLGEVLWASGQTEEARKIWREGRSKDSSNDVLKETLARLRVEL